MASFRETVITFSLISLLFFAGISFLVQFQIENDAPTSLLENELINRTFNNLSASISSQQTTSNTSQDAFDSEIPAPGFGSLIIFAIVGVAQGFSSLITNIYNILIVLPIVALGIPSQVANVLGLILGVTLIFLAWRVYRVGS